jgi:hypothetical protein
MKPDYLKTREDLTAVILFGVAVFLGVLILIRIGSFFVTTATAEKIVENAIAQSGSDPNDMEKHFVKSKEIAAKLKEKNLFTLPLPKQHPVKQVSGILGDEVLIDGKWYKAGDKIQDANIVAIEPTLVRIEWGGKEKTFAPISAASVSEPEKKPVEKRPKRKETTLQVEQPTEEEVVSEAPSEEDPLAWMGVKLSPALRVKFLEKWNQMSDEEKQQAKEEWGKMSDEQKQQAVEQMEQNIDNI